MPEHETITVRPGPNLKPGQVAIWERDPAHPDGEVYLAAPHAGEDAETAQVARTLEVSKRIADGRLLETQATPKPKPVEAAISQHGATTTTTSPTGSALDTPGLLTDAQRDALAAAGFFTPADIRAASDDDLTAVDGIGPATVQRLRDAVKE